MRPPISPTDSPIFVVGTGRSGTTLLRMMLCAHPRIYLTQELSFYVWLTGFLKQKLPEEDFPEHLVRGFSYRWLKLDPSTWRHEVPSPYTHADRVALHTAVMRAKAAEHGKVRWGDKTPSHSANLAEIFEDFPDARVVRIVRDPRAVVRSLNRMPWAPGTVSGAAIMVESERRQVEPFKDRIHEVLLEELLKDPRAVMGGVLDFVGESWSDQVLAHEVHGPGLDDLPPVPWFASAADPVTPFRDHDWSRVDPVRLRLMERLTRSCLDEFDYPVAELEEEPSRLAVLWAWLSEQPTVLREAWVVLRILWLGRANTGRNDTAAYKAVFRRLNPRAWDQWPGFEMPDPPELTGL